MPNSELCSRILWSARVLSVNPTLKVGRWRWRICTGAIVWSACSHSWRAVFRLSNLNLFYLYSHLYSVQECGFAFGLGFLFCAIQCKQSSDLWVEEVRGEGLDDVKELQEISSVWELTEAMVLAGYIWFILEMCNILSLWNSFIFQGYKMIQFTI